MDSPLVEIKNLTKYFRSPNSAFQTRNRWVKAVDGVSFNIYPGETVGWVGESGCGKSTLLRAIAGFENIDLGDITINGETVSSKGTFTPAEKRRVGMVFQDYALFPHLTVEDNVAFGTKSISKSDKASLVGQMLKSVSYTHLTLPTKA